MSRKSSILKEHDGAGGYDVELFNSEDPKGVIVCSHGRGVRRWDGEHFFYAVAEHYADYACLLVDQNQFENDTCKLNPLPIAISRVQSLIKMAEKQYPGLPVTIIGHSMGCGLVTMLDLAVVAKVVFVAPTAGDETRKLIGRYGSDVRQGKLTVSVDGLKKYMSQEYVESVEGVVWQDKYQELLGRNKQIYVFEAGEEEIVGEDRLLLRDMPFAKYIVIPGAKHNFTGEPLDLLFSGIDRILTSD